MMTGPMECHCIRPTEIPGTSQLYGAYLEKFPAVSEFYAHPPTLEAVRAVAGEVQIDPLLRREVCEVLREQNKGFGSDAAVERSLDLLAGGAVAIVTGQQVGLFSGPSYTIYKALTAIRLAAELSAAGTPAVPVFWLASEDHDLEEVNHCYWRGASATEKLELPGGSAVGRRVGEVPLGDSVSALAERAGEALAGPGAADLARALTECYRPAETFGSAFGKLMTRLFAGRGLILLDPLSPKLHRLAAPVYRAALENHAELRRELVARSKTLEQAGYHAQVKVADGSTLLFVSVDGARLPLRVRNDEFVLGRRTVPRAELLDWLAKSPQDFSANAVLRPVIQDTLLPTAAYIAGPAEIAYFAQASVTYRHLQARMPVIFPRASVTLVDKNSQRLLGKYGLGFGDLLRGRAQVRSQMERALVPEALTRRFENGESVLQKLLGELREPLTELDATLGGALDTSQKKMLYQFTKLRGQAGRAAAFRSGVLDTHEETLLGRLYPHDELQERRLCFLPILAAEGFELLGEIERKITLGGAQHQVLYL